MDIHDVLSNHLFRMVSTFVVAALLQHYPVTLLVVLILDNEDHVETRQDGSLDIDVLWGLGQCLPVRNTMNIDRPPQDFSLRHIDQRQG